MSVAEVHDSLTERAIHDMKEKRKDAFAGLVTGLFMIYECALLSNLSFYPVRPGIAVFVAGAVITLLASLQIAYYHVKIALNIWNS